MSGTMPQMSAMRMGTKPRHATANTTTKYSAVKMPMLMKSLPLRCLPPAGAPTAALPLAGMGAGPPCCCCVMNRHLS